MTIAKRVQAIVQSFEGGHESNLRSCAGMILFSVPHGGLAPKAGLISMVRGQPNENLVLNLLGNSDFLRRLDKSFGYQINLKILGEWALKSYLFMKQRTPERSG